MHRRLVRFLRRIYALPAGAAQPYRIPWHISSPHLTWVRASNRLAHPAALHRTQVLRNLSQQDNLPVKRRFGPYVEQMVTLLRVGWGPVGVLYTVARH